ncbi:MFS transporter [Spirillospora sp. CA-253888]
MTAPVGAPEAAVAEPVRPVSLSWSLRLGLCHLGLMLGWITLIQIVLPEHAAQVDPANKESVLAVVLGIGAFVSTLSNPLFGALSDRTASRFGRRRPWIAGGVLGGAAAIALLGLQNTVVGLVIGWCLVHIGLNAAYAATNAALPDQVPVTQRGRVAGLVAIGQSVGPLLGVAVVAMAVTGLMPGYLALAGLVLVLGLPFAFARGDVPIDRARREPFAWRSFLAGFWVSPRRHPDFAWAWATRFLVLLSQTLGTGYLLYYLRDEVRYEQIFPGHDAGEGLLILLVVGTVAGIVPSLLAGWYSDRTGRRRGVVCATSLMQAAAGALLMVTPSWPVVLLAAVVLGAGQGAYLAVDQALISDVLPRPDERGRDLGVINIANAGPQVLGPIIAAPLVTQFGYPALYGAAVALASAAAILIWRIRSVR